jgi:hypothetical protein
VRSQPTQASAISIPTHRRYKSSSFGWNPSAKKEELFDQQSIFLLARVADDSETRADELVAYAMFRFERENRQNVVYW